MLTAREIEVLRLLAQGCCYNQVAQRMGISVHTVGTHIKNAYRKLCVHSAAGAVARAAELGVLALKPGGDPCDAGRDVGLNVDGDRARRRLEGGELAL